MSALVSILMPAYNAAPFIAEAIESVQNQTYTHWELIVIDDGSQDNTEQEVRRFQSDTRVVYLRQPQNSGVSAARNRGLEVMRGAFFCFLDADDVFPPRSLEARMALFEQNPEIEFVDGCVLKKDFQLRETLFTKIHTFSGNPLRALVRMDARCFLGNTWMIRRKPEKQYAFLSGLTHCEDLLFYLSIASTGIYVATEIPVLYYRSNPNSAMQNLAGLENGYARLYAEVCKMGVSWRDKWYLKYRITRIMALSYLRKDGFWAGGRAFFRNVFR